MVLRTVKDGKIDSDLTYCKVSLWSEKLTVQTGILIFCCLVTKSCLTLFETPLTVAHQATLSMGFARQEHWCGLPFPSPGDLPDPGIKSVSSAVQADSLPTELRGKPVIAWKNLNISSIYQVCFTDPLCSESWLSVYNACSLSHAELVVLTGLGVIDLL